MLEEGGRIRDKVPLSELPAEQQKIHQALVLGHVILHLALHLKEPIAHYISSREIARDSDPSLMSHPIKLEATGLEPKPEEMIGMIPLLSVGDRPHWLHIGVEGHLEAHNKAQELARIIVAMTDESE